ncbi:MAG: PQQ-binding-like beta-propeller repeat protein, partial [Vicinamibacterales bacterium]
LLYRDTVIIYQDQNRGAFVVALDKRTGETRWRTDRSARVGWGTPVAITVGDHDELIVSSQRLVQSYDPVTGDELWRCEGMLREVIPTPVAGLGLVFCTSGRAGPTLAIRPGGRGDVTDTHVAWKTTRGSPFVPSPVLYGNYLYTLNDMSSIITCLNATTGETVWQERLGRPRREGISASPVVVDDRLFVTNDEGLTFVLKTGPEFELLHTNDIGARTLASPALVDGVWYIRTSGELFAISD